VYVICNRQLVFIGFFKLSPTTGGRGILFSGRLSVRPLTPLSCVAISLYWVERCQLNVPQTFITWVGIAERGFQGQRSRSRSSVYKCVNATTAEEYISPVWRRGSVVFCCVERFALLLSASWYNRITFSVKCPLHDVRALWPSVYDSDLGGAGMDAFIMYPHKNLTNTQLSSFNPLRAIVSDMGIYDVPGKGYSDFSLFITRGAIICRPKAQNSESDMA